MKNAEFKTLTNDKGIEQAGIEYAIVDKHLYVRFDLERPAEFSKTGKSRVIAYTGGGSIPELGKHGGYFRGGCGLQLSDVEKKRAKALAKKAEYEALMAELGE